MIDELSAFAKAESEPLPVTSVATVLNYTTVRRVIEIPVGRQKVAVG